MKLKTIIVLLIFALLVGSGLYLIYSKPAQNIRSLIPLNHPPISLEKDSSVFFFGDSFAITGEFTHFYNYSGQGISPPFKLDGNYVHNFVINDVSQNYALVNGDAIYKIDGDNLESFFTLNETVRALKEYGSYLFLLVEGKGGVLVPKYLDLENTMLFDFGLEENLYYIDSNFYMQDSSLSLLTLDLDSPYPTSKILTYNNNLSLVGVISSVDRFFFKVLKHPRDTILIGNEGLVCYNMENEITFETKFNIPVDPRIVEKQGDLLISLGAFISDGESEESYNGIFLDKEGSKQNLNLPLYLDDIIFEGESFLAIQNGRKVLRFNREGKITEAFPINKDALKILQNPYNLNEFIFLNKDGTLQIYTFKQED